MDSHGSLGYLHSRIIIRGGKMRIKLLKCAICFDWYSPWRSHCPVCGSARIKVSANEYIHISPANESRPGIQVVNGFNHYHFTENALEIARVLAGKD